MFFFILLFLVSVCEGSKVVRGEDKTIVQIETMELAVYRT